MGCAASAIEDVEGEDEQKRLGVHPRKSIFRNSIISSIVSREEKDEDGSDSESDDSSLPAPSNEENQAREEEEKKQLICGTDVSVESVIEILAQRFHKPLDPSTSWIAERLNNATATEAAYRSAVLRLTFGWDEHNVPSSYVLKVPVSREAREDEKAKQMYTKFKRECNTYEWVVNFKKIIAPDIFCIKKHQTESGGAMILMQDLAERGTQGSAREGLSVDLVRDLLKRLALIHAQSRRDNSWISAVPDLPSSYYSSISNRYLDIREFFERHEVERSRLEAIKKYFTVEYLTKIVTDSADELNIQKMLVHGQPFTSNVFHRDGNVIGIIDWSTCHAGCFGEDVAKAICWNLSMKERIEHTSNLLEGYHVHLVRYAGNDFTVSFDLVRKAFDKFVPLAMVVLLHKVLKEQDDQHNEPLFERGRTLIQNVYSNDKLLADAEAEAVFHKMSTMSDGIDPKGTMAKKSDSSPTIDIPPPNWNRVVHPNQVPQPEATAPSS